MEISPKQLFFMVLAPNDPILHYMGAPGAMIPALVNSPHITLLNCHSLIPILYYNASLEWKYL